MKTVTGSLKTNKRTVAKNEVKRQTKRESAQNCIRFAGEMVAATKEIMEF